MKKKHLKRELARLREIAADERMERQLLEVLYERTADALQSRTPMGFRVEGKK